LPRMLGALEGEEEMVKIPKRNATVNEVVSFYLTSRAFSDLAPKSQKDYTYHLDKVCTTKVEGRALGDYMVRNLRSRHTNQAYQIWLASGVYTANYRKAVLSAAWKHGMRHDVMDNDPTRLVKMTATKPRKVKWTRDQVKQFLNTAYSDYKFRSIGLIVHMAYEWAQRIGDMRVLTWDKLDLDAQRIDLTQSKRGADVHLPITDSLTQMLIKQKEDFGFQQYVAPMPTPTIGYYPPYPIDRIDGAINAVKDAAGLPDNLTAMDLRRTAITEMIEAGVDLAGVMQVSGHKSPNSVSPYMVNTFTGASTALQKRGQMDEDEY
jgi:integrase